MPRTELQGACISECQSAPSTNTEATNKNQLTSEALYVRIIIPTFNEEKTIARLLDELYEQIQQHIPAEMHISQHPRSNKKVSSIIDATSHTSTSELLINARAVLLEVICVDGGSTDNTCKLIENHPLHPVLLHTPKGRATQMNAGARYRINVHHTTPDTLVFIHADTQLPADFLDECVRLSLLPGKTWAAFGVRFDSRRPLMWSNRLLSNRRAFKRGIVFGDQGMVISRELFEEVGGFPALPLMEDFQLSLSLRERGYTPERAAHPLTTSARRYGTNPFHVLWVMLQMWWLRQRYLHGDDISDIARAYRDVR